MFKYRYREEEFSYIVSLPDGWIDLYSIDAKDCVERGDIRTLDTYKLGDTRTIIDRKKSDSIPLYKELGIPQSVYDSDCPLKAPLAAHLELTLACPLQCKHCFNFGGLPRETAMTTDEFKDVIAQLKEMTIFSLFFTGGEPTLHPDFLEIVHYADSLDMDVFVLTNGMHLTESLVAALPRRVYVVISFDGIDYHKQSREKITFEDLVTVFDLLKKYNIVFTSQYVLQRDNIEDVIKTYKWCAENEIDFAAIDLYPTGRAMLHPEIFPTTEQLPLFGKLAQTKFTYEKRIAEWEKKDKRTDIPNPYLFTFMARLEEIFERSYSGVFFAYIASDGTVYPDGWHAGEDLFPAGNVREKQFKTIWETSFADFRKLVRWSLFKACRTCPVSAHYCDYRLPAFSHNLHGDFTSCGATDVMKEVTLLRVNMRHELENALSVDKARSIDSW